MDREERMHKLLMGKLDEEVRPAFTRLNVDSIPIEERRVFELAKALLPAAIAHGGPIDAYRLAYRWSREFHAFAEEQARERA